MIGEAAEVQQAALQIGVSAQPIELIRRGSNSVYRLPDGVIARFGPPDGHLTATHEIAVADWLHDAGIETVRPLRGVPQPTASPTTGRPNSWWEELPPHRPATPAELGRVLASLHQLPVPVEPALPVLEPFDKLAAHIQDAASISQQDRHWLLHHLEQLQQRWADLPPSSGEQHDVVHGDAWQGNLAATRDGRLILLDLEHVAIGPAEWDLTALAVDHTDFARIDHIAYQSFVDAYGGLDVTTWPGYRVVADIYELRWVCFALTRAESDSNTRTEADHRIACLRGEIPRPWTWNQL